MPQMKRARSLSVAGLGPDEKKTKVCPSSADDMGSENVTPPQEYGRADSDSSSQEKMIHTNITMTHKAAHPTQAVESQEEDLPNVGESAFVGRHLPVHSNIKLFPKSQDDFGSDSGYDTDSDIASISELSSGLSHFALSNTRLIALFGVEDEGDDADDEYHEADEDDDLDEVFSEVSEHVYFKSTLCDVRNHGPQARFLGNLSNTYRLHHIQKINPIEGHPTDFFDLDQFVYPELNLSSTSNSFSSGSHSSYCSDDSDTQPSSSDPTDTEDRDEFTTFSPWIQAHYADTDMYADRNDMTASDEEFFEEPPPSSPLTTESLLDYFYGKDDEEGYDEVEEHQVRMERKAQDRA